MPVMKSVVVCDGAPETLQVTVLSPSARRSKVAVGHGPPQLAWVEQPATNTLIAAVNPISTAAALDMVASLTPPFRPGVDPQDRRGN